MPNYPNMEILSQYKGKLYVKENTHNLEIHRSYIFVRKTTSLKFRLVNYFSFVISSFITGIFKIKKQDAIICESPPLFLGITAIALKKFLRAKLIMNIADLWPEQAEKLGLVTNKFILRITYKLEKFIYNHSDLITGQTMGIVNNIKQRNPHSVVYWLRNGIDINNYHEFRIRPEAIEPLNKNDFILIYAGIIGYAQGLDTIVHSAYQLKAHQDIKFLLVGSGPEKDRLIRMKDDLKLDNLFFKEPVPKHEIPGLVSFAGAGIVPLKKMPFFQGAIPSKIFDILGSKKPLLLGVEGEAYNLFIEKGNCGLFFEPENSEDLSKKILQLYFDKQLGCQLGENGFEFVSKFFNWDNIADELLATLERNL
jgi:glycosyltransferase involved in cell wall biosynthesis